MPGLEVRDLSSANTEQDPQHFHIAYPLGQLRVKTSTTLLDVGKVEAGRVSDRLQKIGVIQIVIRPGNCCMFPNCQGWNGLWERIPEIGVSCAAAVPRPPASVYAKLHQVGDSSDLIGPCRLTAGKGTEAI